jgi:hypothetical protein
MILYIPLALHITAGLIGLASGATALYALKGLTLHRRSGMLFVFAMLPMCVLGGLISAGWSVAPAVNIPAAVMTSYLVLTGLTTVRPLPVGWRWLQVGLMLVALTVGLTDLTFAFEALTSANGRSHGFPAFPFILFGVAGVVGSAGDIRLLRSGPLQGAPRIARHLWRMSFALFIAALSFFIGQAKVFPKPLQTPGLLALPVLTVLVTMFYWLWRVRFRSRMLALSEGSESPLDVARDDPERSRRVEGELAIDALRLRL